MGGSGSVAAQLMFGDAICPCCIGGGQGQGLEAINHVVPLNNNKEAWLSKSGTYGLDILNESQGPPPFSLLTYHAEHHLYALHLLWLVVGGS